MKISPCKDCGEFLDENGTHLCACSKSNNSETPNSSEDEAPVFHHPCRQTCSGWKQGFEFGEETQKKISVVEIAQLKDLLKIADEALEEIEAMSVCSEERQRHQGIFMDWKDISRQALSKIRAATNPQEDK